MKFRTFPIPPTPFCHLYFHWVQYQTNIWRSQPAMHSSGTGCILISDSKTGTVCRLYFYTSCILAADFIAVHGISPSSQLTLVNFQVRQGYGYQQCVIHVLNSEVRCNMTLITTRCSIALFHVQCSMFTVFTLCVSSMCIVFTLCAIFNVHCVRTLCTLSEMHSFKHLWWGASPHSCGRDTVGRVKDICLLCMCNWCYTADKCMTSCYASNRIRSRRHTDVCP